MNAFTYENEKTREISFPLGGIGSGTVGLAGNGQLIDMEIFNRPNKGSHAGLTHFAVKAEQDGKLVDARVLNADVFTPYTGKYHRPHFNSYGFGVDRASLAGLPHFRTCSFTGEFPIANLAFTEERFPGQVEMTAFNPFIPTNEDDSSIPGAFFTITIENTTDKALDYSVAFTASNLYTKKGGVHHFYEEQGVKLIHLTNSKPKEDPFYGDLSVATDAECTSQQLYWYRGNWFDNLATYWNDFKAPGAIKERVYEEQKRSTDDNYAADDLATMVAHFSLEAGERREVRFVLTWNTPNYYNYWNPEVSEEEEIQRAWKNYYAHLFADSKASALYAMKEYGRLYGQTKLFKDTLFASTMPHEVLDAVSANISILKSPTCIRLEDGSLYGFEGLHTDAGCCEGSCTHVWSYTYAMAFLFPKLERSMRTLEYKYSMREDGSVGFRLMLPVGRKPWDFHACVDGQYASVMRVYREFKVSGDVEWLRSIWPQVKSSIEYAWSDKNADRWDYDKDGVMEGRQHHTLDMELFGPNAWLTGLYLGGLKAGAEMADQLGDTAAAEEYRTIFEKGSKVLNTELFNGEYYYHKIDLKDKSVLAPYAEGGLSLHHQDIYDAYWNEEQQEIMYQIGEGSGIDQVLAQWHANLTGLGDIFEPEKVRSALQAIYRYNYIPNMREHFNPCRLYCVNDEGGLVICNWPEGKVKPFITAPYSEETMHGFEYQAACHMIQEGFEQEGLTCVKALRDRYDGEKRNPWNEYECGSNYARSMASYALLLSYSGFRYDMSKGMIGFAPIGDRTAFSSFWSLEQGWGEVRFDSGSVTIDVLYGSLPIGRIELPGNPAPKTVLVDGKPVEFSYENDAIILTKPLDVESSVQVDYE